MNFWKLRNEPSRRGVWGSEEFFSAVLRGNIR